MDRMSDVGVLWARAPTLEKLEHELSRLLAGHAPEDVLGVSHTSAVIASQQSGGIWGGAATANKLEYSAIVLIARG
ncbi:MAG: hypothetical protein ACRDLR_08480 [Gaiellaceae bacterium]